VNCLCDDFRFPPAIEIAAGLTRLHRQTGTFGEFRRALLHGASVRSTNALETHPLWSMRFLIERDRDGLRASLDAIGRWRGRHPQDFGLMLVEMWAYVCDLTSFYDEVFAHECYVRTARRRESLRRLVGPLGYVPRPAVAALAEVAVFADGRQAVVLPAGTAFRSGAFHGNPPQVFEVKGDTVIHPLLNEWTLLPVRPQNLPVTSTALTSLLCRPGTVNVKAGDLVIVEIASAPQPKHVVSVTDYTGADGEAYVRVTFDSSLVVNAQPYSSVRLLKPSAIASQWKRTVNGEGAIGMNFIYLDTINRAIRKGQYVLLAGGGVSHALIVDRNEDENRTLTASGSVTYTPSGGGTGTSVSVPAVLAPVSRIYFTANISGTVAAASPHIDVHYAFADAGTVTAESSVEIDHNDVLRVRTPLERPRDATTPGEFQLEDKNGLGLGRPGNLNFATGEFTVQGDPWPSTLIAPARLFGNVVETSHGETVNGEILGAGNAAVANQSFVLKKTPLTYLPSPSPDTPSRLTSTLQVYVDRVRWTEVPSFYGRPSSAEIYIVRQNDKNESVVTFGDGVLGRRLSSGSIVLAYYRHGAGAATPPAGSITQIAKPVVGLKSVRGPVAPFGGADAEPATSLRKYAPRSALLLGRAISLTDLEAAVASYSGVRAAAAEWRWSSQLQVPAAHIWYLADGDLTELIRTELKTLTQPDTPISVEPALPFPALLSIQLKHDPRRFEEDVLAAARTALMDVEFGLLPPERLGIGKPLFRSRIFEFLLRVPGVQSVTGLRYWLWPFSEYGIKPPAGGSFDFSYGVYLNGRSE
jgi:hypothetical protein